MKSVFITIFFIALIASCVNSNSIGDSSKPNVIIVLTDDQGYADVGFNGCKDIPTPNLDRIAEEGAMFTNGYVSYAVCGPSRAGLITGRYQDRFGFGRNPLFTPNDPEMGLPLSEETLAAALARAGYTSMAIGKWHLGAHESLRPMNRGFDEFFGFLTGGHQYFPKDWTFNDISAVKAQFEAYRTKLLMNDTRVDEQEYLTDALSREAVSFVERNAAGPFFLYLAYNAPHTPMQATEKYLDRFQHIKNKKRRIYAAMVSAVDDGVGALLDKLDDLDIADNTIVFFLSDNGGPEQANGSINDPLREGKSSLYEGGIRVPFALRWPAEIKEGIVFNEAVISLDIFATAIANAGVQPKNALDGVNLLPFLQGNTQGSPHENLFWRKFDSEFNAVRSSDIKLVNYKNSVNELFNLADDISEKQGFKSPEDSIRMKSLWDSWDVQMMDPVFLGLLQDKEYDKLHPDRWDVEPY